MSQTVPTRRWYTRKRFFIGVPVLVAVLTFAGCSALAVTVLVAARSDDDVKASGAPSPSAAPEPSVSPPPEPVEPREPAEPEESEEVGVLAFGDISTYRSDAGVDGLAVSISAPVPFTPGPSAAKGPEPQFVAVDVTLHNLGPDVYDPVGLRSTAQSGGAESQPVFDSDAGVGRVPSTSLLPGATVTYTVAFGALDPAAVVVELSPGRPYDPVIFTSTPPGADGAPPEGDAGNA